MNQAWMVILNWRRRTGSTNNIAHLGSDGGKPKLSPDQPLAQRWFPVPDDVVGGWAVATADKPVSLLDIDRGEVEVGLCLTEMVARHIAKCHNESLVVSVT